MLLEHLSKTVFVNGVGNVVLTRRKTCKRLLIRINMNREVNVSIPYRVSLDDGERFLLEKIDWIKDTSQKIKTKQESRTIFDENTEFSTQQRKLVIRRISGPKFQLEFLKDTILINVPISLNIQESLVQKSIKKILVHAFRLEAAENLPQRVAFLAKKHGFNFEQVRVKNASSRWGSCSFRNNINLNIHLIRLPEELSDYVIIHELVHTVHKNHGPHFWDLLEKTAGNAKEKANMLRNFHLHEFF